MGFVKTIDGISDRYLETFEFHDAKKITFF